MDILGINTAIQKGIQSAAAAAGGLEKAGAGDLQAAIAAELQAVLAIENNAGSQARQTIKSLDGWTLEYSGSIKLVGPKES